MSDSASQRVAGEAVKAMEERGAVAEQRVREQLGAPAQIPAEWLDIYHRACVAERESVARQGPSGELEGNVASSVALVFETLFKTLLDQWSAPEHLAVLSDSDARESQQRLERIAEAIGFVLPDAPRELRFLRVTCGKAYWTLRKDRRGLAQLLALNLIEAESDPSHPLRTLAAAWPEALQFLQALHEARNPESHGSGTQSAGLRIDACAGMYRALRPIGMIFGFATDAAHGGGFEREVVDTVQQRIRLEAITSINERYGERLDSHGGLRERLRRMECRLAWLRDAACDGSSWAIVRPTSIELVREAGSAIEIAVGALLYSGDRLTRDGRWSCCLEVDAQELGFELKEGRLPEEIANAKRVAVLAAANSCQGTLGALAQALLRSAVPDPEHPLRLVAKRRPQWLNSVAMVGRTRGHADCALQSVEACEELAQSVHQIIDDTLIALAGGFQHENDTGNEIHDDEQHTVD
jgi:hypothetical protein